MSWKRIVLIGAGGVAESLLYNLVKCGLPPQAIYNRSRERALSLAECYNPAMEAVFSLSELPLDADYYIFALSDSAIEEVASLMPQTGGIWMHTAAMLPPEVLRIYHQEASVFYPLNTFSQGLPISMHQTPFFIEATSQRVQEEAMLLASKLTSLVYASTLALRERLHIAAVFGCNFVNHLLSKSAFFLKLQQLPLQVLEPLVQETIRKAFALNPVEVQTGPARRQDYTTIEAHRQVLSSEAPELLSLYDLLTESISTQYNV